MSDDHTRKLQNERLRSLKREKLSKDPEYAALLAENEKLRAENAALKSKAKKDPVVPAVPLTPEPPPIANSGETPPVEAEPPPPSAPSGEEKKTDPATKESKPPKGGKK